MSPVPGVPTNPPPYVAPDGLRWVVIPSPVPSWDLQPIAPAPAPAPSPSPSPPSPTPPSPPVPPVPAKPLPRWPIVTVVLVALFGGVWLWGYWSGTTPTPAPAPIPGPGPTPGPTPLPPVPPAPLPVPVVGTIYSAIVYDDATKTPALAAITGSITIRDALEKADATWMVWTASEANATNPLLRSFADQAGLPALVVWGRTGKLIWKGPMPPTEAEIVAKIKAIRAGTN